ncbi:fruit-body specific protein A [Infundibulicybe gibba]|nr:fruit-body specific protein A [Infundibulicybe gibba]
MRFSALFVAASFSAAASAAVYNSTFTNLTAAVNTGDFITFSLQPTTAACTAFCTSVTNCTFANSYLDVNGKNGTTMLTCSLYTKCHNAVDATNTGGQIQPNGKPDTIASSDGFCRVS